MSFQRRHGGFPCPWNAQFVCFSLKIQPPRANSSSEEPPAQPSPGSRECQGRAQMDSELSAFLEFLPDCSHMDPDSWSSAAPAPSPPGIRGEILEQIGEKIPGISFSQEPLTVALRGHFITKAPL